MKAPLSRDVYLLRSLSSFVYVRGGPRIAGIEVQSSGTLSEVAERLLTSSSANPQNSG